MWQAPHKEEQRSQGPKRPADTRRFRFDGALVVPTASAFGFSLFLRGRERHDAADVRLVVRVHRAVRVHARSTRRPSSTAYSRTELTRGSRPAPPPGTRPRTSRSGRAQHRLGDTHGQMEAMTFGAQAIVRRTCMEGGEAPAYATRADCPPLFQRLPVARPAANAHPVDRTNAGRSAWRTRSATTRTSRT